MKIGNLLVNAAYLGERVLTAVAVGATKVWEGVSKYIKFKDPVVEQICMKWSSDGVGLTPEDAAKVTNIGTTFNNNTGITSFDELERFTSLTVLPYASFSSDTNLISVRCPKNIVSIDSFAFNTCSKLVSVGNLGNVEGIGEYAFYKCKNLESITLERVKTIGSKAFYECSNLTEIGDISNVKEVPTSCFESCSSMKRIDLQNATIISSRAFVSCANLMSVGNISRVLNIGDTAFANSISLGKIELEDITNISNLAFYNCPKLLLFVCKATTPPTLGANAFGLTSNDMRIYVPDESVEAYKSATNWSAYADRIKPMSEYQPTNE